MLSIWQILYSFSDEIIAHSDRDQCPNRKHKKRLFGRICFQKKRGNYKRGPLQGENQLKKGKCAKTGQKKRISKFQILTIGFILVKSWGGFCKRYPNWFEKVRENQIKKDHSVRLRGSLTFISEPTDFIIPRKMCAKFLKPKSICWDQINPPSWVEYI